MPASTVRLHLAALERAGLVERVPSEISGRGRPRVRYRSLGENGRGGIPQRPDEHFAPRRAALLASILLEGLRAQPEGHQRAMRAGAAWGEQDGAAARNDRSPGAAPDHDRSARGLLTGYLAELGFQPHPAADATPGPASAEGARRDEAESLPAPVVDIELHNCPFQEVFDRSGDLVCAVHAGIMRGALGAWGHTGVNTELTPFVRPRVCRVRLSEAAA